MKKNKPKALLSIAAWLIVISFFDGVFGGPTTQAADADPVDALTALITAGDLDEAAKAAKILNDQADPTIDLTMPMARLGRAFQKAGDLERAAEFYSHAVSASEQATAESLGSDTILLVRLAAASTISQTGRLPEAISVLRGALTPPHQASEAQRQSAATIALRIGAAGLGIGDAPTAAEAYALAMSVADPNQTPTAMLGAAWAAAVSQTQPVEAAKKLAAFVDAFPDHADAPRATRACAECLRQAERGDDANAKLAELLDRWPSSDSAIEVVRGYSGLAADLVPPAVRHWIITKAKANDLDGLDAKATILGISIAIDSGDVQAWTNLTRHLAATDLSGDGVGAVLSMLDRNDRKAEAERLVAAWVSPAEGEDVTPAVREAACRWAGVNQHWSMLAMASESELEKIESPAVHRTEKVERLFAESLMQVGRVAEAGRWWNHLVDSREAIDFATLLRCAEAETSAGTDLSLAQQRIAIARAAASGDRFNMTLVDMLAAELAIRKTHFDEARSLLESIVRATDTGAGLRGRGQFLIGETYYLQAQYAAAIEAYRQVESIDADGTWVSASLVQAGKSFEQLGRTREAAVCYGSLVKRFADSPHAQVARSRMAALTPSASSLRR